MKAMIRGKAVIQLVLVSIIVLLMNMQQACADEYSGPIIDAHAQFGHRISSEEVMDIVKRAGISKIILSTTFRGEQSDILELAKKYPDMVVPAVRTKYKDYNDNRVKIWRSRIDRQVRANKYYAMQELLGYHAAKIGKDGSDWGGEVIVPPLDPRIKVAIAVAIEQNWPITLHYEFSSLDSEEKIKYLEQLSTLIREYPDHPFVLTHLGQLQVQEAEELILLHPNLYFTLAETTNIRQRGLDGRYPFTATFRRNADKGTLRKGWRELLIKYPDRFILSFDGVTPDIWRYHYGGAVEEWRIALGKMPQEVANLIAHGNAERLWPVLSR